ncbi:TonB-dependent receptor domain-containing protein [Polyangium aurulentum]|uniref:TonB-dependent receptor domain-containing protein n=1 Tax=Polyangium aurulentum TaxID=2567896 RepID=UPI0010AECA40|nr:TonB-dependent receptor [Polyangium aurulentum]UQA59816.1 TonB-dependent receptor [Polyangium aurulentum]
MARPALGQEPPTAGAASPIAPASALSTITGVALDTTSKAPMAGVTVTLSSPSLAGGEQTAVTDANGVYTFKDLPAGKYQVRFETSGFKSLARDVELEEAKSVTADVELLPEQPTASPAATLGSSAITGVAIDTTSKKPVADVVVTLTSPSLPGGEMIEVTDAKGAFTFKGLPAGSYKVRFEGPAFKPLAKDITVASGKRFTANVELLPDLLVEEIVVTGTRIPRLGIDTAAPVTTVSRAQILGSGRTSVGDVLQTLPEQTGGINTSVNNGGDGSTRINLRGFGTNRTLVLVNGRRMVAGGTGADPTVDLNTIPTAAIERIEILKDGASAVYGSDAISGVVNIITRTDYNATEISGFTGISQHGDGRIYDVSFTTGHSTERGNIIFSAGFYNQTTVWAGNRDFSRYDYGVAGYDWDSARKFTGGSSATPVGRFGKPAGMGNAAWEALKEQYPDAVNFTIGADGKWRPFNSAGVTEAGGDFYNYQPAQYLVTPQTRVSLYSSGSFRLKGSVKAYYEAMYTHRESEQRLAAEPLFTDTEGVVVSKDNLYNPWGVDFTTVRRRLVEFGNRIYNQDLDTFRVVTGVKGNFMPTWNWDMSVNYGRTQGVSTRAGLLQLSKLARALGPSYRDEDGVARCGTPDAPIAGCVPLNLFGGAGAITPEMRDYLTYKGTGRGYNQQILLSLGTAGEIVKIANAPRKIGFAAGFEHRREAGALIRDPLTAQGDTTGTKGADTQGAYTVNEAFVEVNLPILGRFGDWAGPGTLLELDAAARFVNYSTFGSNFTYKAGARVSPIKDITLRGTFATAFRAPSVNELYLGARDDFPNVTDPCANRTQGTELDKACDAQGVPDDLADDRGQLMSRIGGNATLQPETAKSFTIGAVLVPRWLKDVELTVDYYNIAVTNSIQSVTPAVILASCYPAQGGVAPTYCERIRRSADGLIRSIDDPLTNVGGDRISGVDFQVDYSPQTPIGAVGLTFNFNYLGFYDRTLADGRVINAKGTYDLQLVLPSWKGNINLAYAHGGWNGMLVVRWRQGFRECEDNACQQTDPSAPPPRSRDVSAYAAADLNIGYKLSHPGGSATNFGVGVNNLFDATPPYIVNGFLAASDATAYDFMGRYFYLRMSHEIK